MSETRMHLDGLFSTDHKVYKMYKYRLNLLSWINSKIGRSLPTGQG